MFAHSRDLFRLSNGLKIDFIVLESSYDLAIVSSLIEWGGGSVSIKSEPMPNVINLSCKRLPWMDHYELFSTSYIYSCCRRNQRNSLRDFSIGKYLTEEELKRLDKKYLSLPSTQDSSLSSTSVQGVKTILEKCCSKENTSSEESSQIGRTRQDIQVFGDSKEVFSKNTNEVQKEESKIERESLTSCSTIREAMDIHLPLTFLANDKCFAMKEETIPSEIFPNDSASMEKCIIKSRSISTTSSGMTCQTLIKHEDEWKEHVATWLGYLPDSS